ncbi:sulfatase-like hydrolase/transferase [Hespellia stercorisuis]|uniref:sulfatase-like hydrolase/transferase n=1 Tax=Hespellia stercorisuis TaxID=180311 RepID=UPI002E8DDF97|nr:sulfatase-like hydrolase/transferase [Hespellia stercorisuis]
MAALLCVIAALLRCSVDWMFATWSNLTMDELVYHMNAPLDGTNEGMVTDYIGSCVAPAVVVLLIVVILFTAFKNKRKLYYIVMAVVSGLSLLVGGSAVYTAWTGLDVGDYTENKSTYSTFIDTNYVNPNSVELTFPEQRRNLIYIFLESMEVTYTDKKNGGGFKEGCIPELTKLAQENEDFSGTDKALNGGYSMPGTTWTVAAMFAQSSGLPLDIAIESNSMDTQDSFFPEVTTLGNILEDEGYTQDLLIGSEAEFGGRSLLYTDHGDFDIYDYTYAEENGWIPEGYKVWWGYEDKRLFEFAKDRLKDLSSSEEPFNLTMLTVDTHFEDGYLCEDCPDTYGDNQYANVMACSSKKVAEFVEWIQKQDFYEDTTIVISGDHPTMDTDFCDDVADDYTRKVYTAYINPATEPEATNERNYTTFDDFPTTLASLGVDIEGNRLGLGTNLFSSEQTLSERYGIETEAMELSRNSKMMENLADINTDVPELLAREGKVPAGVVTAGEYDVENGLLPIVVSDISNVNSGIESILAAVWTAEDRSDLTWIQMQSQDGNSYAGNVAVTDFDYKTGEYQVEIYLVDGNGNQFDIGGTTGVVQ